MREYPSDLTDKQWELIAPLIPPPKHGGRPRKTDERLIVDALLYISRTGCQWRYLPERTFGWFNRYRRLSKDYEIYPQSSEAWIKIAMINILVHRLKPG